MSTTRFTRYEFQITTNADLSHRDYPGRSFEIEISRDETTRSEGQYRQCLDIPPCKTCRGHIRRARDRPNPPKGAFTAPRGACPPIGRFSTIFGPETDENKVSSTSNCSNRLAPSSPTYERIVPSVSVSAEIFNHDRASHRGIDIELRRDPKDVYRLHGLRPPRAMMDEVKRESLIFE